MRREQCRRCAGKGRIRKGKTPCAVCAGSGFVLVTDDGIAPAECPGCKTSAPYHHRLSCDVGSGPVAK